MQFSQHQEDAFKTVSSLIKFNNGLFKSPKQAEFILSGKLTYVWMDRPATEEDVDAAKRLFNVDLKLGQSMINIEGYVRFADYGVRSVRRVGWMYVMDQHGFVAQYKLAYGYDKTGRSSWVDEKRTKLIWTRPANVELPVFEAPAEVNPGSHLGTVGAKIDFIAKVIKIRSMGFGEYGERFLSTLETESGDTVLYWNAIRAEEGQKVEVRASVKQHTEYKGKAQTVVQRAKVLKVVA